MCAANQWSGLAFGWLALAAVAAASASASLESKAADVWRDRMPSALRGEWQVRHTTTRTEGPAQETVSRAWFDKTHYRLEGHDAWYLRPMVILETPAAGRVVVLPGANIVHHWQPGLSRLFPLEEDLVTESFRRRGEARREGREQRNGRWCTVVTYDSPTVFMGTPVIRHVREWIGPEGWPLRRVIRTERFIVNCTMRSTVFEPSETVSVLESIRLNGPAPAPDRFVLPAGAVWEEPPAYGAQCELFSSPQP